MQIIKKTTMRKILLIIFCLNYSLVYSQEKQSPVYYLNSVKYSDIDNIYINPQNIDSVRIKKETENGEIYIKLKSEKLNFLTISDILKKYSEVNKYDYPIIYFINGELILDESKVKIDDTFFIDEKTQNLSSVVYIEKEFRKQVIVLITLSQEKIKPRIMLRGNDVVKMKEFYY